MKVREMSGGAATGLKSRTSHITVHPLSDALGAEIRGVDASQVDIDDFETVLQAWRDHLVLLFRDQTISAPEQIRFASCFGTVEPRTSKPEEEILADAKISGHRDILLISNIRKDGKLIGSLPDGEMDFHSDSCFRERPAKAAFLYAMEIPQVGGDTMFLNMYKAYETLPQRLKQAVAGRKALNVYSYGVVTRGGNRPDLSKAAHCWHPMVRTHPDTHRKLLYVNRLMTLQVEGLSDEESRTLLEELFDHIEQPQFIYTHQWRPGDLLLWDNRCTLHARTDFSADERRLLRRCSLVGDLPYETAPQ
jgi:taurine dioxygenase